MLHVLCVSMALILCNNFLLLACRAKLHHNAAAVHIPIGLESKHEGVIDVIQNKAITFEGKLG